jgi:hypothetical protein
MSAFGGVAHRAKTEVSFRPTSRTMAGSSITIGIPARISNTQSENSMHRFVCQRQSFLHVQCLFCTYSSWPSAVQGYLRVNPDIWSPAPFPDECTAIKVLVLMET